MFIWQRDNTELKNDDPLWWVNHPGPWVSDQHCLIMLVYESNYIGLFNWERKLQRPYISHPCSRSFNLLCEGKKTNRLCNVCWNTNLLNYCQ